MTAQNHTPNFTDCNPKAVVRKDGYLSEDPSTWLKPDEPLMAGGYDWAWCYVWFKDVQGAPGYRVGSNGTVWSCWVGKTNPRMTAIWKPLKGCPTNSSGHLRVGLCRDGKRNDRFVHRLVLETFVGPCPPNLECCHDPDPDPSNNRLGNLRWDTRRANHADACRHGTATLVKGHKRTPCGEANPRAKLTEDLARKAVAIRSETRAGAVEICRQLGIPDRMRDAINGVVMGRSWNHVTGLPPYSPKAAKVADQNRT